MSTWGRWMDGLILFVLSLSFLLVECLLRSRSQQLAADCNVHDCALPGSRAPKMYNCQQFTYSCLDQDNSQEPCCHAGPHCQYLSSFHSIVTNPMTVHTGCSIETQLVKNQLVLTSFFRLARQSFKESCAQSFVEYHFLCQSHLVCCHDYHLESII